VDPRRDTSAVLRKWLEGFDARPGWSAAAPLVETDGDTLRTFTGGAPTAPNNHTTQVLIFNREGLLIRRTFQLPEAEDGHHLAEGLSAGS
jgi:protein SCO1/2